VCLEPGIQKSGDEAADSHGNRNNDNRAGQALLLDLGFVFHWTRRSLGRIICIGHNHSGVEAGPAPRSRLQPESFDQRSADRSTYKAARHDPKHSGGYSHGRGSGHAPLFEALAECQRRRRTAGQRDGTRQDAY
jgi:hypothetical protein